MLKKLLILLLGVSLVSCHSSKVSHDDVENDVDLFKSEDLEIKDDDQIKKDYILFIQSLEDDIKESMAAEENFSYSTLGLSIPLSVAINFAENEDRDHLFESLGLDPQMDLAKEAGILEFRSVEDETEPSMEYHNSLWVNRIKPIETLPLKKDAAKFKGNIYVLDFNEIADEKYQEWQKEVFGKALSSRQFDEKEALFLANGLEFNTSFFNPFEQDDTREDDFYNENGSKIRIDMMNQELAVPYEKEENYERILLPMDHGFSCSIILPEEGSFEKVLEDLGEIRKLEIPEEKMVQLALPRLDMKKSLDLGDSLKRSRLAPLFDFYDNHISKEKIKVSDIGQSSEIELHEQGISVKALSEISMETRSMSPDERVSMRVNRPFFLLVEKRIETDHGPMNLPVYTMGIRDMTSFIDD